MKTGTKIFVALAALQLGMLGCERENKTNEGSNPSTRSTQSSQAVPPIGGGPQAMEAGMQGPSGIYGTGSAAPYGGGPSAMDAGIYQAPSKSRDAGTHGMGTPYPPQQGTQPRTPNPSNGYGE